VSTWGVIQAEERGVTDSRTLEEVAPGGTLILLRPPADVDPCKTVALARLYVGARYGFLTIASILIDKLTPSWFHFPIRKEGTWICSALGCEALRYGGWLRRWPDVYEVDPAEAMHALLELGAHPVFVSEIQPGDVGFAESRDLIAKGIRLVQHLHGEADWEVNHMFVIDHPVT